MIRIAVCEDDPIQRDIITDMLNEYITSSTEILSVSAYENGEALLRAVEEGELFDIFLLDIMMPGLNGIETAEHLRRTSPDSPLVFLTADKSFAFDSYKVHAFDYLLKPPEVSSLSRVMDSCVRQIREKGDLALCVKTAAGDRMISLSRIQCVTMSDRRLIYCLDTGEKVESTTVRGGFKSCNVEMLADNRFLLCGVSCIINLDQVQKLGRDSDVTMKNGEVFYISRSAFGELKKLM